MFFEILIIIFFLIVIFVLVICFKKYYFKYGESEGQRQKPVELENNSCNEREDEFGEKKLLQADEQVQVVTSNEVDVEKKEPCQDDGSSLAVNEEQTKASEIENIEIEVKQVLDELVENIVIAEDERLEKVNILVIGNNEFLSFDDNSLLFSVLLQLYGYLKHDTLVEAKSDKWLVEQISSFKMFQGGKEDLVQVVNDEFLIRFIYPNYDCKGGDFARRLVDSLEQIEKCKTLSAILILVEKSQNEDKPPELATFFREIFSHFGKEIAKKLIFYFLNEPQETFLSKLETYLKEEVEKKFNVKIRLKRGQNCVHVSYAAFAYLVSLNQTSNSADLSEFESLLAAEWAKSSEQTKHLFNRIRALNSLKI